MSSNTDLGTKEIHLRKSVMIEGGPMPRARVMNQSQIDSLLMKGLINQSEHQAGEYFLEQCSRASVFVKSIDFRLAGCGRSTHNQDHYYGIWPYARTMKLLTKALGREYAWLTQEVIVNDKDVSSDPVMLECLRESLRLISLRRLSS